VKNWHLFENNPALRREDWLPDESPWSELAELRETHVRLLAERERKFKAVLDLRHEFEREDEEKKSALTAAYLDGGDAETVAVTPDEDRVTLIREATEHAEATSDAVGEFLGQAVEILAEKRAEWERDLDEHRRIAVEKKTEALRLAAEAEAEAHKFDRLRVWLSRADARDSGFHHAWGLLETPTPTKQPPLSSALAGTDLAYAGVNDGAA
jgi:hypothetical protein